jgi:hypothetical protein
MRFAMDFGDMTYVFTPKVAGNGALLVTAVVNLRRILSFFLTQQTNKQTVNVQPLHFAHE